jgi:hypothetical protein
LSLLIWLNIQSTPNMGIPWKTGAISKTTAL